MSYHLAHYAKKAYDEHTVRLDFDVEVLLDVDGTIGVIAIRGSEMNWADWFRNFMAWPSKCGDIGRAPHGFTRSAERIYDYLTSDCAFMGQYTAYKITGHSQGAAVAILLGEMLSDAGFNIVQCAAFAAPRTGKRELRVPTKIYDHAGDKVCKVPFFWRQPVRPIVLPDMSDGPLQHSMDYYLKALSQ